MLHLEAEWTSKQNILIADTSLAEPGPQPGLRFGGKNTFLWGKGFNFYHTFKTNFSEHNKIWWGTKRFGNNCPRMPHHVCGPAWAEPSPESLPLGASCLCRRLDILKIYF